VNVESDATYENGVLKPDRPLPLGDKQRVRITVHAAEPNGEAFRLRQELARDLLAIIDSLVPLVGNVALATRLQLLKSGLVHFTLAWTLGAVHPWSSWSACRP